MTHRLTPEQTIKRLRIAAHLNEEEFAAKISLTLDELKEIENGKVRPDKDKMEKIANVLGVDIDHLIFEEMKPQSK